MTTNKIKNTIAGIFLALGAENQIDRMDAYYRIFRQADPELFAEAAARAVLALQNRGLPMPSEIMREYKHVRDGTPADPEALARREAENILRMVRANGANHVPDFADPITSRLFKSRFNWRSLCENLREDSVQWFVRDFIDFYVTEKRFDEIPKLSQDAARQFFLNHKLKPLKRIG